MDRVTFIYVIYNAVAYRPFFFFLYVIDDENLILK